jgi:hypothetical protein
MAKPQQQPEQDQISINDPNEPDVIAFADAGTEPDPGTCPIGTHWNGRECVADDLQPQRTT